MADGGGSVAARSPGSGLSTQEQQGLLKKLVNDLAPVKSKWSEIGMELGLQYEALEVIRLDRSQRGGVTDCFTAMLDTWLQGTEKSPNDIWITVCGVLKELKKNRLAGEIARKRGVIPRIVEHPKVQHTVLGGAATFKCKTSISGFQITYKWLRSRDGRNSEVNQKGKPASAELTIAEVTESHRGQYRCIVKSEFGEEESQSAELIIGKRLNPDTKTVSLKEILNGVGIKDTAWPEIGECLGQDLRRIFVGGICMRIKECPFDKTNLWQRIADTLQAQGMGAAVQEAKRNTGKKLDESTVNELFKEANIKDPDWCKIDWKLWEQVSSQHTEHDHEGSERCSVATILTHRSITWERLAKALKRIEGYEFAADKIRAECTVAEVTRERMDDVFRDASKVNWRQIVETFSSFNKSCLIEVLMKWLSQQESKDPWILWRRLAASVESLKDGSEDPKEVKCQLGIGYKLRQKLGVGLELNKDNLFKVLSRAGIENNWNIIVSGLDLDESFVLKVIHTVARWFGKAESIHAQILENWPSPQSWEELARVIDVSKNLKHGQKSRQLSGPEIAQETRQLSGSGGFPVINFLYSHSQLKSKFVRSEMTVTLKCEARGAPPLRYTWTCDDVDLPLPDSWTVQFQVRRSGLYNCRVENDFGSCTFKDPIHLVHGDAPTCKFDDQQKKNIQTGNQLNLHCTAGGSPPLTYTWLHDGDPCEPQKCNGPDLVIEKVKPEDSGKYECRVENDFGKDSSPIEIKVGEPPQIKSIGFKGPEKKHYERGVKLEFYCKATGAPTYTWRCHKGGSVAEVGHDDSLEVGTSEETEGKYTCQVKNDFGSITSDPIEIKVGDKPIVKDPPKISGKVVSGERVQLTCAVAGNGSFEYFWIHDNQTLVKEAGFCSQSLEAELSIKEMTAANQGEYKCHFINSYGFCVSEPVSLQLGIELEELMKQLCTPIAHRWCWFGILLGVKKPILVRISRGFAASGDVKHSLEEVIRSWLEMKHNPQRPHSWATIQDVVQRMGNEALARELGSLTKPASSTQQKAEECAKYDAKDMQIGFENLAGKAEEMLSIPDSSDTESGSTRRDADAVVSGIRAYLHLIRFKDEEIQEITNLHSVIEILRQYLNYQRYHLLEKVIVQFGSGEAQTEMKQFIGQFSMYQATTLLGNFVPPERSPDEHQLISEGNPPNSAAKKPPFMNSFKIVLESKWATCTLTDAENLLVNLLPDTVSREFVWFSTAYRAEENSVCLEYLVSPAVIELLGNEMETRKQTLSSMGVHCVHVDSTVFKTEQYQESRVHTEQQGTNPQAMHLLMKHLEELKFEVPQRRIKKIRTEETSDIEATEQDPLVADSKPDSEETTALRTALQDTRTALEDTRMALEETRTAHNREIEALQRKIEALKKSTTAVTLHQRDKGLLEAQIKSVKESMSGEIEEKLTAHVASLEIDTKIQHGIRKQLRQAPTRSLLDSVSSPTEKASPGSTGAQTGENAAGNGQSQDQGQTQESLFAASLSKQIQEMFKAQQQHIESYIARKFEEHEVKPQRNTNC